MAPVYTGMQCLQIQGYFICKYFGDINMQYGGICFIYILNIYIILSNNYWIKLGCVYMEMIHLHIAMCFGMIVIQVLSQQIFCRQIYNMQKAWKHILVPIVCKPTRLNPSG